MTITGRVPLLLVLGLVPVVVRPEASTVRLWLLVVGVVIVILLAAASSAASSASAARSAVG